MVATGTGMIGINKACEPGRRRVIWLTAAVHAVRERGGASSHASLARTPALQLLAGCSPAHPPQMCQYLHELPKE